MLLAIAPLCGNAESKKASPPTPCARLTPGSRVAQAPDLFSRNGALVVNLTYNTMVDTNGITRYCFVTSDGMESPTFHIHPGDRLTLHVTNNVPDPMTMNMAIPPSDVCGASSMTGASVNLHLHGTNTPPVCHQDEVINTMINTGETFTYNFQFPANEPPGLYWYHPHVHGNAEAAVLGGASGAIIVEGIQNEQPAVAGLPQQTLIVRDQLVPGNPTPGGTIPSWDVNLNYVTISSCQTCSPIFRPAVMVVRPDQKQFWRVLNASADTILDLQLQYDGVAQPLTIVGLDGVPVNSQDGTIPGRTLTKTDILLPPAARAEFIVTTPSQSVRNASFRTLNIATGQDGDNDPARPLATIRTSENASNPPLVVPAVSGRPSSRRFAELKSALTTANRTLYFSEVLSDPSDPNSPTNFYITVQGATPTLFSASNPPAIVTTQGAVEDWTIQNQSLENHAFHIHQIHFLLLAANGIPVPPEQQQYLDTIQVPAWSGSGPFPAVTVRMDFRGDVVGDFVYHCHILEHEDGGMMAIIRVNPATSEPSISTTISKNVH